MGWIGVGRGGAIVCVHGHRPAEYLEFVNRVQRAFCGDSPTLTSAGAPAVLLDDWLTGEVLTAFLLDFDLLFSHVAGSPARMAAFVTKSGRRGAWVRPAARELFRRCKLQFPAVLLP